jgi:hypothetical protein
MGIVKQIMAAQAPTTGVISNCIMTEQEYVPIEKSAPIVTVPPKMSSNMRHPRNEFMILGKSARRPNMW